MSDVLQHIPDYHVHTRFSCDSETALVVACEAAIARGLREIGFVDHADFGPDDPPDYFRPAAYLTEIARCRTRYDGQLTIRAGVEIGEPHVFFREAQAVLAALPKVKQTQSRCALLGVLGKIGDNNALPVLVAALKDKNPEIQTAAIRSLAEWPTPEPMLDLQKVAGSSDNKLHRILALRGFVRLLALESERPAEKTLELYKKAMSLAPDVSEKRRVLSGLANAKSRGALEMATTYLEDEGLSREAEYAVVKIAEGIAADFPELAKDTLKKAIERTENDTLRNQAQEVLDKME